MSLHTPTDKIGAEMADALEPDIIESSGYRILIDIVRDRKIVLLYKGHLSQSSPKSQTFLFPRLKMMFIPAWLFIQHLRNGFVPRNRIEADVAIPVLWGVFKSDGNKKIAGVQRFTDDTYLYGEHFSPPRIVHIFGDWSIPPGGKMEWSEAMDERGIPHADRNDFGVNWRLLHITLRATCGVIRGCFRRNSNHPLANEMWRATVKGLYHYLLKNYEMENVGYKVELVKNDYNPGHVADTIAANQNGRKRIGVSHVSSAVDSPQICFVHFDRYATVCPMQEKWHGRFWDGIKMERVGKESIDSVVMEHNRRRETYNRLNRRYMSGHKWTVTILFPGNAERCLVKQWDKMYESLVAFAKTDIDARIFLRFRRLTEALDVPHMARLASLPSMDSRFICEHDDFNTHQLMVVSDLIITANASFAINEALVIGKPVFTFDYTLKAHLYFGEYGKDFILTESEQVLRVIKGISEPFCGKEVDWNRMLADADYYHDGRNRKRLAGVVAEMVREVA